MTEEMHWQDAVTAVTPYIVRIFTPYGSGTGFVFCHSEAGDVFGVATAAHVISEAHNWETLIKVEHFASGAQITLRPENRAVFIDYERDTAAIVFAPDEAKLPTEPPKLIDEGKLIKVGVQIGWLGFPAVSPKKLCFFAGPVSAHLDGESGYLVDGVAINGVSGGPAMWLMYDQIRYIGVVSAYIPNRATGESLPGLAVVQDVTEFYDILKRFKSVDEARKQQSPPEPQVALPEPIPPSPAPESPGST